MSTIRSRLHSVTDDRRRPTLKDVAALAGVSIKTVSRVVNQEPFVSDDVNARVQAAVRTLGYRPDHMASTLKRANRSATIGLVIADVANPFFSAITRVVENAALAEGHLLITVSSTTIHGASGRSSIGSSSGASTDC